MTIYPLYAKIQHWEWGWVCLTYPGAGEMSFPRVVHALAHDLTHWHKHSLGVCMQSVRVK